MTARYHDFMIFGSRSVYCGLCHQSPSECRCDVSFLQSPPVSLPQPQRCPHCGALLTASTPAADAPNAPPPVASEAPKKTNETWHDRPPLL